MKKFKFQIIFNILFLTAQRVYGQNELNNPDQFGTTSLIILLFFLFTIFGILAAFLIRHKPRTYKSVRRSKLDIEKQIENEKSSKDLSVLNDDSNQIATFDFLDHKENNKPFIRFSDRKSFLYEDQQNSQSLENSNLKEKLMQNYLKHPSSEDLSYRSPDSLNKNMTNINLDEDSLDTNTQSPQFQEIPKNLLIANVEPIANNDDTQTEPFQNTELEPDTFSSSYKIEEDRLNEIDLLEDELSGNLDDVDKSKNDRFEEIDIKLNPKTDDEKSENEKLDEEQKKDDILLKDMVETKKELTKLLDKQAQRNRLHSDEESINKCNLCSDTYHDNLKKGENEMLKRMANIDIPEYSLFPDETTDSVKSDHDSMKSGKSHKSYHSYGFPHEEYPSTSIQPTEFDSEDKLNSNPALRWRKLYDNLKLEKPSDYNELMKSWNSLPEQQKDQSNEDLNSKETKAIQSNTEDKQNELINGQSNDSVQYEFKKIVCPPLDPNDPNAKYVDKKDEQNKNDLEHKNEFISSPEETNPEKLISESLLNESENSDVQSDRFSSQDESDSKSKDFANDNKALGTFKFADKFDETGSLITLNSVDASLVDYAISKNPTELNQNENYNLSSQITSIQLTSTQLSSQPVDKSKAPKSVLDVLERRKNKI